LCIFEQFLNILTLFFIYRRDRSERKDWVCFSWFRISGTTPGNRHPEKTPELSGLELKISGLWPANWVCFFLRKTT